MGLTTQESLRLRYKELVQQAEQEIAKEKHVCPIWLI